jgi:hypothetical protein
VISAVKVVKRTVVKTLKNAAALLQDTRPAFSWNTVGERQENANARSPPQARR